MRTRPTEELARERGIGPSGPSKKEARTCGVSSLCVLAQGNSVVAVNLSLRLIEMTTTAKSVPGTSELKICDAQGPPAFCSRE